MSLPLLLGVALLSPAQAQPAPDHFPLALHRSMEVDDIEREIQRQHEVILARRAHLATTRHLVQKGAASRSDLEGELADVHFQEAKEAELIAYRNLKEYERDVLSRAIPADDALGYSLLLDLLKKQEAMAQVELDYRAQRLQQDQELYRRRVLTRSELDEAQIDYDSARASVALSQARQAQVALDLATRTGAQAPDPGEARRLKVEYLKARIRYYEVRAAGARSRLTSAQERARLGLIALDQVEIFQKVYDECQEDLATERKQLDELDDSPLPARFSRFG